MYNLIPGIKWRGWLGTKLTKRSTFAEVAKTAQRYGITLNVDGPMVEVGIASDISFITDAEHCVERVQALVEIIEDYSSKMEYAGILRKYDLACHAAFKELEETLGRLLYEKGGER